MSSNMYKTFIRVQSRHPDAVSFIHNLEVTIKSFLNKKINKGIFLFLNISFRIFL